MAENTNAAAEQTAAATAAPAADEGWLRGAAGSALTSVSPLSSAYIISFCRTRYNRF